MKAIYKLSVAVLAGVWLLVQWQSKTSVRRFNRLCMSLQKSM
jgi:hypothetical protein